MLGPTSHRAENTTMKSSDPFIEAEEALLFEGSTSKIIINKQLKQRKMGWSVARI